MQSTYRDHLLDDERARFDFGRCHAWLTTAYWSTGITRSEVERGFANSTLIVGAYREDQQNGCLRVVSDRTRFAYFMDVFVDPSVRGQGLGRAMVRFALQHPDLAPVYKWTLATHDAHAVYRVLGFEDLDHPEHWMLLARPRPWLRDAE